MKKKKRFAVPALLLAVCLLLAGCGKDKNPGDVETDDPPSSMGVYEQVPAETGDLDFDLAPADLPANGGQDNADPADTVVFRAEFTEKAEAAGFSLSEAVFSGSYGTPSVSWTEYGDGWGIWCELLEGTGQGSGERTFRERMSDAMAREDASPYMGVPTENSGVFLIENEYGVDLYLLDYQPGTGQAAYMMVHMDGGSGAEFSPEAATLIRGFLAVAGLVEQYPGLSAMGAD